MEFDTLSDEDYDKIFSVAFPLYDSFNTSEENIKMSTLIVDNIRLHDANHYFKRAVIATLTFFIDNNFNIVTTLSNFGVNLQLGIPAGWEHVIRLSVDDGVEHRAVRFFIRKNTQTYELSFSTFCPIDSESGTVSIMLVHCGNHRVFPTGLHSSEMNGLSDTNQGRSLAFGTQIVKKLTKAMDLPVKKAALDQAPSPSTPMSPI